MTAWSIEEIRAARNDGRAMVVGGSFAAICDYLDVPEDERAGVPEPEGTLIDIQTANVMVTVYDGLNDINRELFAALPVHRAASIAWKLVK